MTVLCYVRPWNEQQFKIIAEHAFPEEQIHLISDFPKHGPFFLQEKLVAQFRKEQGFSAIVDAHLEDIIARCRLLRTIDKSHAISLVNACYKTINDLFNELQPRYVIGLTVDSYVIDIIRFVAEERGLTYFGLVPLFINGYCRISARGELNQFRDVSDEEVDVVYNRLINLQEKPSFLNSFNSNNDLKKIWKKNKTKRFLRLIYMASMRLRSPAYWYCYHYWHSYLFMKIQGEKIDHNVFSQFKFDTNISKSCYLPLQYFPECTVDYWVTEQAKIDYYNVLIDVIRLLSMQGIHVYLKEHPNCLSIRPQGFYKKVKSFSNVTLISPIINSNELINSTDFTLVWTGSAGMEAVLLGKPVVHLGNPYYITDSTGFVSWEQFKDNNYVIEDSITEHDKKSIIKHVLKGAIEASFAPDPRRLSIEKEFLMASIIGEKIRESLKRVIQ